MEQRTEPPVCRICGKIAYRTWSAANSAARRTRRHRNQKVSAYHSRRCDCYHVGGVGLKRTSGRTL